MEHSDEFTLAYELHSKKLQETTGPGTDGVEMGSFYIVVLILLLYDLNVCFFTPQPL